MMEHIQWEMVRKTVNIILKDGMQKEAVELKESMEKARAYRRWLKHMQNRERENDNT